MTREELESLVVNREGQIELFQELPKQHQDKAMAHLWISHGRGSLRDIPEALIDDDLRLAAMAPWSGSESTNRLNIIDSLGLIEPGHTERYAEIALRGVINCSPAIWSVDFSFLTSDFLKKTLAGNPLALASLVRDEDRFTRSKIVIDQDVIDLAVSNSTGYFGYFKAHQYTEGAIRNLINKILINYEELITIGRFNVLIEMIREGFWPGNFHKLPTDLDDGIDLMMEGSFLYQAYVMQYPTKEVIEKMTTPERKAMLRKMYPAEELLKHMQGTHLGGDRAFKGSLLESELGL
jgi:hypothetical protein